MVLKDGFLATPGWTPVPVTSSYHPLKDSFELHPPFKYSASEIFVQLGLGFGTCVVFHPNYAVSVYCVTFSLSAKPSLWKDLECTTQTLCNN